MTSPVGADEQRTRDNAWKVPSFCLLQELLPHPGLAWAEPRRGPSLELRSPVGLLLPQLHSLGEGPGPLRCFHQLLLFTSSSPRGDLVPEPRKAKLLMRQDQSSNTTGMQPASLLSPGTRLCCQAPAGLLIPSGREP